MTAVLAPAMVRRPAFSFGRWLEREGVFSWLMVALPVAFLMALVGYPFFYGIWISLQDRPVAKPGVFIGLGNFIAAWHDPVFWQVVINTFVYTFAATLLKMVGGLGLALVMNQDFRFKNLTRALLLLPFIVPTVLSTIAWQWILDPAFSVINWALMATGLANPGPSWLGNPHLAMVSLIMVNTWRGLPFYAITLLAGLQTISPELYEAATIDGAGTLGPLPLRHPAAAEAGHLHRHHVLGDLHLRRLPADLRADPRRAGQRHPCLRHLRLRHRHGRRPVRPGCGDRARHGAAAGADHPRHGDLHAAGKVMSAERATP